MAVQERLRGGEMQLRIGVHQGDVVVEGDDLLGDGVNVAARLVQRSPEMGSYRFARRTGRIIAERPLEPGTVKRLRLQPGEARML
jgi:class 3 adenylate cyclase